MKDSGWGKHHHDPETCEYQLPHHQKPSSLHPCQSPSWYSQSPPPLESLEDMDCLLAWNRYNYLFNQRNCSRSYLNWISSVVNCLCQSHSLTPTSLTSSLGGTWSVKPRKYKQKPYSKMSWIDTSFIPSWSLYSCKLSCKTNLRKSINVWCFGSFQVVGF